MVQVSDEDFMEMVEAAVARIPKRFADHLDNVSFMAAEAPTPEQLRKNRVRGMLLGLYEGIPLPARNNGYNGVLPDIITVFKRPHEQLSRDRDDLREQVRHTVWHEVAHYFGLNHDRINALEK
jgi:predicted Zn-dependent protease with MMP-like domain